MCVYDRRRRAPPPPLVSPCARSRGAEPARRPTVYIVLFFFVQLSCLRTSYEFLTTAQLSARRTLRLTNFQFLKYTTYRFPV